MTAIRYNNRVINYKVKMSDDRPKEIRNFCIQKAYDKGPLHLLQTVKLNHLQNKINFFEGQVDPLLFDNISLKDQLISLSRMVILSTEILRNLLPPPEDPNAKLKLSMANIEEIAEMIKEDWHRMVRNLDENGKTITRLITERNDWKFQYVCQKEMHEKDVTELRTICRETQQRYKAQISQLKEEIEALMVQQQEEKKNIKEQFNNRIQGYLAAQKEFLRYKRDVKDRQQQYEKAICRLKSEIDASLISFEESKKNIKAIYDKLMTDKLNEQAEGFEMMLKIKEEEKLELMIRMGEIEEEFKRRAAQKQYQITKLSQQNDRHRSEIGVLKNQMWCKQLQLDEAFEKTRVIDKMLANLEQQRQRLENTLKENEKMYKQERQNLQNTINRRQKQLAILRDESSNNLQKILFQKCSLQKELSQKQQKLRQTLINLRKRDEVWQIQLQKQKDQWLQQQQKLKNKLQQQMKMNSRFAEQLKLSRQQNQKIISDNEEKIKRIQQNFQLQRFILQRKFDAKVTEMQQNQQETLRQIKQHHRRQLTEANIAANESLREIIASCNKKMNEQETRFILQRQSLQIKIKTAEQQSKYLQQKLSIANQTLQQQQQKHQLAIKNLHALAAQQKQRWSQQMDKQKRQFQNQIQKQQARLNEFKAEMEKQIKMLKQANAIETIQNKFLNEISKLKDEFAARFKEVQQQRKKQVEALADAHEQQMEKLKIGFDKDLTVIAANIEQKSSAINEKLISDFSDIEGQDFSKKMNAQQKKQFIVHKIKEIKSNNVEKQKKITQIQYALHQSQKTLEKRVKMKQQELEKQKQQFKKKCQQKTQAAFIQCKAKVAQIQKQRIQHAQMMYQQFHVLRQQHLKQIQALNKKYHQLQIIFQQRPSRMQDLTKIKQLMNMQTKLDIEIQSYQKKMETANQIVKYLNLELQNYKDVYDIFAPGSDAAGGLVGVSALRGSGHNQNSTANDQHILDVIKSHKAKESKESKQSKQVRQGRYFSQQKRETVRQKQPLPFRKWNQSPNSPVIRDLKLFDEEQSEKSFVLSRDLSEQKEKEKKEQKYSYLILQKRGQRRLKFKTQKPQKLQHQSQIMLHAQNFIKLLKGANQSPNPTVNEMDSERKKSYRKRKLHRRQPTQDYDHYF